MIAVESYIAWQGTLGVVVHHAPHGRLCYNGAPGTRTIRLDESEARELLTQLTRALSTPPQCIDCGSSSHAADSPSCLVATRGECDE